MPLYTDSNYYYSGGSSQPYSPYYTGSPSATPTSSNIYSPYSSTYNRSISGSYMVPISSTRTSSYSSPHSLSSRYQPKLSTITETSPLISSARHSTLMPLTRIQSPKYTSYSSSSTVHTPKYIPPRPILINTADIDVSANRYRKRKEEVLRQAQRETEYTSPSSSVKRKLTTDIRVEQEEKEQRLRNERNEATAKQASEPNKELSPEQHINRSTIRRNRAVVRLSTIRSRSKDRSDNNEANFSSSMPEKVFKDLPTYEPPEETPLKWREKLADDLADIPSYRNKISPGEVLVENYLIQDSKDEQDYADQCRAQRMTADMPKETIEQIIFEIDPLHHMVRRLSIPQCPTFHDICEDISSDKIDDDLNAGELRRRASIIQCQEQEILNELQKSDPETFQMVTLERRESCSSVDLKMPHHKRHSKRSSKKVKKLRTKITAVVNVENAPVLSSIISENPDEFNATKPLNPKFKINIDSIEEHHNISKVFKLPKTKNIKRMSKVKEQELPKGFMSSLPKPENSPKKKFVKASAEVFTFDEETLKKELNQTDDKKPTLKTSQSLDYEKILPTTKILEKSNSLNVEFKNPPTPKTPNNKKESTLKSITESSKTEDKKISPKTLKTSSSVDNDTQTTSKKILEKSNSVPVELKPPLIIQKQGKEKVLKTFQSFHNESKPNLSMLLEKPNSINKELTTPTTPTTPIKTYLKEAIKEESEQATGVKPSMATPKPIKNTVIKSDSGEDFWAQIGSRETLYMNKRKKDIAENQWRKREDLLESTNEKEVRNIKDIKTVVSSQKFEALKKADQDQQNFESTVTRSNSNESALKKKTNTIFKDDKMDKEEKDEQKLMHTEIKSTLNNTDIIPETPVIPKDLKTYDSKLKTNDKLENAKTPGVTKISKEISLSSASPISSSPSTTTSNTTTSPKITGQQAKSPEQQEQVEKNKFIPATQAKNNNNKNETDINKITKTEANEKEHLAKTFTLPTKNAEFTSASPAPTATPTLLAKATEATITKQPETKQINKTSTTIAETNNKINAVTKPKTTDNDNKLFVAKNKQQVNKNSPIETKSITSSNAINADQFIVKAPAKPNTSPVTTTVVATTSSNNSPTIKTLNDKKKTTNTTSTSQTNTDTTTTSTTAADITTTTIQTTTPSDNQGNCKDNSKKNDNNDANNATNICGGTLSKFATVSNLAQCLKDVDADLADYLPSSAEISENDDYNTDDSDFDYSSIDGWEKLTPSMKKKVKQRHRKEKKAEQARFDPQKKIKIDTTRKLYVKDEAPRYPLVATPRPLWKREKIDYPDDDSEDESESDESGSTEETEDSDDCTTSEEYDDELSPNASGGKSGSSHSNKDDPSIIRMSTCSNDSGFEGGTAPASNKKMLECDVNCHKKCERLTANLCGVNQKLIVEALTNVKRGARETRDSPSTPPSSNPVYKIEATEEQDDTSYTYLEFQKSGRFTPPATIIPRFKNYSVDDFHFLAVLGKGSFGKVLLAELRDTTYYYAVKCLKKDVVLEDDDVDSTLIERKVLALGTKHPYLCHLFCTFQTESHLFFVMEYLNGGDLMFHIQESGRFTEERARFYGAEIVSGLKFLHKKGIIYRDLKLDNVLLDYEGHVRIADFGMCKLQIYLDKTADSFCGTPDYMAPEIIKGDKYNQNVDWWSFGVLLYEMLIGQSPFSGCDEDELFWSICNELPWFPVYISAEATNILKGLLEKDHSKRIGSHYSPAGDIVEHIFFRPIDWNLLEKRQIEPPFRPQVKHPLDTQYFDRVFTKERVCLTPIDKDILQSMDQKQFLGFTYTNPHITLD